MPMLATDSVRTPNLAQKLEALFSTHNVTATKLRDRFGDDSDAADWGVVCTDCGRAQDFFLTTNDPTDYNTVRVSDVFLKSFEDTVCEPYYIPGDVPTGDHSIVVHDEDPSETSTSRHAHCSDCGRTTTVPRDPEYAGNGLSYLPDFPCQDTYTIKELAGAVIYPSIDEFPDRDEVGIGNWHAESGRGWSNGLDTYWWHAEVPVTVEIKSDLGVRRVMFNHIEGSLKGTNKRPPGSIRTHTLASIPYQQLNRGRADDGPKNFDVPVDVLTFMQTTDEFDQGDFEAVFNTHSDSVIGHIIDSHTVMDSVPPAP